MSLLVWLPLNGNLENQGLSEVTVTNNGATVDNNGKIGKCYKVNSTARISFPSFSWMTMKPQNNFSFFCWVKGTTNGWLFACSAWELRLTPTYIQIHLSGNGQYPARYNGTFDTNTWYHLGFTWSGVDGKLLLYLNGSKVAESNVPSSANFDIASTFNLPYDGPRYLNDFRIYDHCLSPKEVKEISKALVLHYKLDNGGNGNSNLLKGNYQVVKTSTTTTKSGGLNFTLTADQLKALAGQTLCFSYRVKADGERKTSASGILNNRFGIHGGFNYTATGATSATQLYPFADHLVYSGPETIVQSIWTVPTNIGTINNNLWFAIQTEDTNYASPSDANNIWFIKDVKLEIGNKATPWLPNENDSEYLQGGYNKEIDCGIANTFDGTKKGTFTYSTDTPRYSISTVFNGSNCIVAGNILKNVTEAITVSIWAYMPDWTKLHNGGQTGIVSCLEGGGWGFISSSTQLVFIVGTGTSSNTYRDVRKLLSEISSGWHHLCGTYDGFSTKFYIDGILVGESVKYTTAVPIFYNKNNGIFVGAEAASSATAPDRYFKGGQCSDLRIYATALSATDIAELYHTAGWVDPGIAAAYEFKED